MATITKKTRRQRIRYRIRKKIVGTAERPRLSVFRSNTQMYCQLIDDKQGHTLAAASTKESGVTGTKIEQSFALGKLLASKAEAAGVSNVVFDRSGYLYHGRVKAVADGAREGGLQF
jgi:large subunit ribosomal protein L18